MGQGQVNIILAANSKPLQATLKDAEKDVDGFASQLGNLKSVVGGAFAIGAIVKAGRAVAQLTGEAIDASKSFETLGVQFRVLIGDTVKAAAHMQDLAKFSKETPFQIEEIAEASRLLILFSDGAIGGRKSLTLIGDAAGATGQNIQEVAFWVGRAYTAIKAGRPFGRAARRLQQMGILSATARNEIEDLTEAGKSSDEVWGKFTTEIERFEGGIDLLRNTVAGATSTMKDNWRLAFKEMGDILQPFTKLVIEAWTTVGAAIQSGLETASGVIQRETVKSEKPIDKLLAKMEKVRTKLTAARTRGGGAAPEFAGGMDAGGLSDEETAAIAKTTGLVQRLRQAQMKLMFDRLDIADQIFAREQQIATLKFRSAARGKSGDVDSALQFTTQAIVAQGKLDKLIEKSNKDRLAAEKKIAKERENANKNLARRVEIVQDMVDRQAEIEKTTNAPDQIVDRLGEIGGFSGGQASPQARLAARAIEVEKQQLDIGEKSLKQLEKLNEKEYAATFQSE